MASPLFKPSTFSVVASLPQTEITDTGSVYIADPTNSPLLLYAAISSPMVGKVFHASASTDIVMLEPVLAANSKCLRSF